MEDGRSTAGQKRTGDAMEVDRATKTRHLECGIRGPVADATMFESNISATHCENTGEGNFLASKASPAVIMASKEAISAFDFSELTGALSLSGAGTSNTELRSKSADAHASQHTIVVEVSKQLILKEVLQKLNLKILDMGLVIEGPDFYSAWVDIETPPCEAGAANGRKTIYGHGSYTKPGAIESVCGIATLHLRMFHDVVVKDFNYSRMKMLESKVARQMRKTALLEASFDREKAKNQTTKERCRDASKKLFLICKQFTDILPIAVASVGSSMAQVNDEGMVYNGQRPPVSRLEELAFALTKLATNDFMGSLAKD